MEKRTCIVLITSRIQSSTFRIYIYKFFFIFVNIFLDDQINTTLVNLSFCF